MTTAARLAWYPRCEHSSPVDTLTYACPLHDPLLQADCTGCGAREQRRAETILAERESRRAREITHTEAMTMANAGSGFWGGQTMYEGQSVTRLQVAQRMREDGKSYGEIERVMGGPTNSVLMALQRAERERAAQQQPAPLQVADKPQPTDRVVRDPLEARLPVQEREAEGGADTVIEPEPEIEPRACSECETCDGEQPGCPFDGDYDPFAEYDSGQEQDNEQTAAGILQAFAESEAAAVMALVFEFLEYSGLEAECELFIRFGLWRAAREQQAG